MGIPFDAQLTVLIARAAANLTPMAFLAAVAAECGVFVQSALANWIATPQLYALCTNCRINNLIAP